MTISKLFSSLEGSWHFVRIIPGQATASGRAIFTRFLKDQLQYREEGKIQGGSTFYRDYVYQYQEGMISVFFKENPLRLFQTLQFEELLPQGKEILRSGKGRQVPCRSQIDSPPELPVQNPSFATAIHRCPPDTYDSEYHFLAPNRFQILHRVRGPNKHYDIETTFYKE